MRAFLALEIPPPLRDSLGAIQRRLDARLPEMRWVRPEAMHLTLVFLGEISEDETVRLVAQAAPACATVEPGTVQVAGLGRFPPRGRPRLVWAGVDDPGELLALLHRRLAAAVAEVGLPVERRSFRPHLTLGRSRGGARAADVDVALQQLRVGRIGAVPVRCTHLVQSTLGPDGARYRVHATFPLRGREVDP